MKRSDFLEWLNSWPADTCDVEIRTNPSGQTELVCIMPAGKIFTYNTSIERTLEIPTGNYVRGDWIKLTK
jgi:hypothetical protein